MIQTFDVRQMIDQLLRSLRLKCKGLPKLRWNALKIQLYLFDEGIVDGFEHLFDPPTFGDIEKEVLSKKDKNVSDSSDEELLSLSICGEDETKVADDKKLKAHIKSLLKIEKCEQDMTGIKREPEEKTN